MIVSCFLSGFFSRVFSGFFSRVLTATPAGAGSGGCGGGAPRPPRLTGGGSPRARAVLTAKIGADGVSAPLGARTNPAGGAIHAELRSSEAVALE